MSRLTQLVSFIYRMQDEDTKRLENELMMRREQIWRATLTDLALQYGYGAQTAIGPRNRDRRHLRYLSRRDAERITRTFNRDVERKVEALYRANPRGNRNYYASNLETWLRERAVWKQSQIAVTTETQTVEYTKQRFIAENLSGNIKYRLVGPPTVCEDCTRRFAAGLVDEAYTRRYPCPRHPGCPHSWQPVTGIQRVTRDELWMG